jgi:hypothetical protein
MKKATKRTKPPVKKIIPKSHKGKSQTSRPQPNPKLLREAVLIDPGGWEDGLEIHFQGKTLKGFGGVTIREAIEDLKNDIEDLQTSLDALENMPEGILDLPVLVIEFNTYPPSKIEKAKIEKERKKLLKEHGAKLLENVGE